MGETAGSRGFTGGLFRHACHEMRSPIGFAFVKSSDFQRLSLVQVIESTIFMVIARWMISRPGVAP